MTRARPTLELDKLSYQYRSDASGMLISKGNSLRSASVVRDSSKKANRTYVRGQKRGELVDVGLVLAAIAYYDMALLLMRPFDPNYATAVNWKCNALCSIGQYAEAVTWYEEIVRIDREAHGGAASGDPTAALARKQLASFRSKKNAPLDSRIDDVDDFTAPPFTLYAQEYLRHLASGKYADAAKYFDLEDRTAYSPKRLKQRWTELVGGANLSELSISLQNHLFDWKGKAKTDAGWCYFSVSGADFSDGVAFVIGHSAQGGHAVRSIEFGRP